MFQIWDTMFNLMRVEILLSKKHARFGVYGRTNFVRAEFGIVLGFMVLLNHLEAAGAQVPEFHVGEAGQIRDKIGRERIFHGLNVVMKGCPWHPNIDQFDPQMSFCDTDIALLKQWGMNVVRLAIMWPGVEPIRGQFNSTYLDIMRSIVEKLHKAGIYSLLEFHQDLFTSEFCGEGVPGWVLDRETSSREKDVESGNNKNILEIAGQGEIEERAQDRKLIPYAETFPEPLSPRWPIDEFEGDGKERRPEQCGKHNWFWYYFSYAVSRAFQDLYENRWGWSDLLARYWKTVAHAFHDQAGVLGYELINEPWPGNFFRHPSLLLPGVADRINLAQFYDKLQAAVRSMDPGRILFIETITFDDFTCGFATVPGGDNFRNLTVLSYHYYSPPNLSPRQAFSERVKESKRLGCGAMLTEFFIANIGKKSKWPIVSDMHFKEVKKGEVDGEEKLKSNSWMIKDKVDEVLSAADDHIQSWIGWEYKAFLNKTGSIVEQSLFNHDGEINMLLAKKLARTYPQAVCGKIISYGFNPLTSYFSLYYFAENSFPCSTEIFVHRGFYYPLGLDIAWNPLDCIQVSETESMIYINHTLVCHGFVLNVRITAVGS